MTALLKKHTTLFMLSLLAALLLLARLFPSAGLKLGVAFLLLTFLLTGWLALEKQKDAYRAWQTTRGVFLRNAALEVSGAWVVMVLSGLLGRQAAGLVTGQIGNDLLRTAAGVAAGLLVGLGIGALANKTWRRLLEASPEGRR